MRLCTISICMVSFLCCQVFAEECEPGIVNVHSWNQGANGELEITVPGKTKKWRVEITYDKAPTRIDAHQGKGEKCKKKIKTCAFNSESWNRKQKAGDVLKLGYGIQFKNDPIPPKITSVKFLYCDARPCKWKSKKNVKEHIVCPTEDLPETTTETTEDTTEIETTDEPEGGSCVGSHNFENQWHQGSTGKLEIMVPEDINAWEVSLTFDKPINGVDAHHGVAESCDGVVCTFTNEQWNGLQKTGNLLTLTYQVQYDDAGWNVEDYPKLMSFTFNGALCGEDESPSSESPTVAPTESSTEISTDAPTDSPTENPTVQPTDATTETSSEGPTAIPTKQPTEAPTEGTTVISTAAPTMPTTDGPDTTDCVGSHTLESAWNQGSNGRFDITIPEETSEWVMTVAFDKPVNSIDAHQGKNENCGGMVCTFSNENWNGVQQAGNLLTLSYQIQYDDAGQDASNFPKVIAFAFNDVSGCEGGSPPTVATTQEPTDTPTESPTDSPTDASTVLPTEGPTGQPTDEPTSGPTDDTTETPTDNGQCETVLTNYKDVLHKSLLFYEAQRSGELPEDNRISWRRDSALNDGSDVGLDLTGGYYDAGDYVKFNFPQAQALTTLAWGGITYKDGYKCAGELENLLDAIKWGTDYFIKCHVSDNEFYGQVGNGVIDHAWWGRPEDMGDMSRPSYKIDCQKPGSDLAAEVAASFASAAILFQGEDDAYSEKLIDHAKRIYEFADTCRGKYSDSIWDANTFYKSWNGFNDELVWGAAWLHKATGDDAYLDKAKQYYNQFSLGGQTGVFSWDDKTVGVHALMAELTGDVVYKDSLATFCDHAINGQQKSPGGMLYYMEWGSLRYAANAAFICLQAADLVDGKETAYTNLAQEQMDYILGGNPQGQSFVVGVGSKYPQNPHHASSSCPDPPNACGWNEYNSAPTQHELIGALVGGCRYPDDNYNDERTDYFSNEVTLDYNAGFQSTIAGLQSKKCCTA